MNLLICNNKINKDIVNYIISPFLYKPFDFNIVLAELLFINCKASGCIVFQTLHIAFIPQFRNITNILCRINHWKLMIKQVMKDRFEWIHHYHTISVEVQYKVNNKLFRYFIENLDYLYIRQVNSFHEFSQAKQLF